MLGLQVLDLEGQHSYCPEMILQNISPVSSHQTPETSKISLQCTNNWGFTGFTPLCYPLHITLFCSCLDTNRYDWCIHHNSKPIDLDFCCNVINQQILPFGAFGAIKNHTQKGSENWFARWQLRGASQKLWLVNHGKHAMYGISLIFP